MKWKKISKSTVWSNLWLSLCETLEIVFLIQVSFLSSISWIQNVSSKHQMRPWRLASYDRTQVQKLADHYTRYRLREQLMMECSYLIWGRGLHGLELFTHDYEGHPPTTFEVWEHFVNSSPQLPQAGTGVSNITSQLCWLWTGFFINV